MYPEAKVKANFPEMQKKFWVINKTSSDTADVYLYGDIGYLFGVTASSFVMELKELEKDYSNINIHINSNGGSVFEGLAIIACIKKSGAKLTGYIDGIAASMASVIAMALPKCYMSKYARIMTHRPMGGCWGNADEMRNTAELLEGVEADLVDMIANKAGIGKEEAKAKYVNGQDVWIKAEDALKQGLIDGVYDGDPVSVPDNVNDGQELMNIYNKVILNKLPKEAETIAIII